MSSKGERFSYEDLVKATEDQLVLRLFRELRAGTYNQLDAIADSIKSTCLSIATQYQRTGYMTVKQRNCLIEFQWRNDKDSTFKEQFKNKGQHKGTTQNKGVNSTLYDEHFGDAENCFDYF